MVKKLCFKKYSWLAITFFVVANLVWPGFSFANSFNVTAKDTERIKSSLTVTQTTLQAIDLLGSNKDWMTILNTIVGVGKTGTDITYGLVVLGTLNEMDLVDLVVSGRYRDDAREYFNSVLDQTTDMIPHWKNTVKDIVSLLKKGSAVTPNTGLAMESVVILEKTINIMIATKNWLTVETYNGMWRYFQERMGKESHQEAWSYAMVEMGHSYDATIIDGGRLFAVSKKIYQEEDIQLEQQFATLYETWAPYVTPFGISEEYKKQVKEGLSNTLIAAFNEKNIAKEKFKPSLVDKLYTQLEQLKNNVSTLLSQINPFKAGVALNLSEEISEDEMLEVGPSTLELLPTDEMLEVGPSTSELVEKTNEIEALEISETLEIMATTTMPEDVASTTEPVPEPEPDPDPKPEPETKLESEPDPEPKIVDPVFCERDSGNPARFRVLINEIAWMGTSNSSDDEWIELRNVWGIPVNLNGWQLLDKERQIKIIFGENDAIPANGYFLLERTNDDSMPDVPANLIYTGALANSNEALYLFDNQCNIEDEVLANPNWPAGENSLKKPMSRLDVLDWYSGIGTAGSENGSQPLARTSSVALAPTLNQSPASPEILITETYIGSENNQKDDFVELYNPNLDIVDLTDYYIQRKTEGSQDFSTYVPHELLSSKMINPNSYFLIANASSSFATSADILTTYPLTENNVLVLKDQHQDIINQVSTNAPLTGKSYGRKWSSTTLTYANDFEAQIPTPKTQNQNSEIENSENEEDDTGEFTPGVVINEIAWTGTKANASDEWIELYNNATSSVNLTGWRLITPDGGLEILFPTSTIAANDFYLLERTDDNTISDTAADLIYTGSLGNDGEILELRDANNVLIEKIDCSNGWPAGDNTTKQTMERIDTNNWASNNRVSKNGLDASGNEINGTPGAENSVIKPFTEVIGGLSITEDLTLALLGSPYLVEGSITVNADAKLTIEAGVTIKFKHHSAWKSNLKVNGILSAIGTTDQKITFTSSSTQPAAGDWEWLELENASSTLKNVVIQYAGKKEGNPPENPPFTKGTIYINGGSVEISDSIIEESQTLGIWLTSSPSVKIQNLELKNIAGDWEKPAAIYIASGTPTIENSIFTSNNIGILTENIANPIIKNNIFNNNQIPIQVDNLLSDISGNTFNGNNYNGIYVTGFLLPDDQKSMVWKNPGTPYIAGSLSVEAGLSLRIDPGVTIKFLENARLTINGSFEAAGTSDDPIIFTSNSNGRWHYIYFAPSSLSPVIEHANISNGGWYNVFQGGPDAKSGAVKVDGANLTVKNSLFENNLYAGLELANATVTLENIIFNKNENGIYVGSGDCPNLSQVKFGEEENVNSLNIWPASCAPDN